MNSLLPLENRKYKNYYEWGPNSMPSIRLTMDEFIYYQKNIIDLSQGK